MNCISRSLWLALFLCGFASSHRAEAWTGPTDKQRSAVYASQRQHSEFFAKGSDGYLHYHFFYAGTWRVDKASFRKGGKVDGPIAATYSPYQRHAEAVYKGTDGYLRLFYIDRRKRTGWKMVTLRSAGKVTGDISALYEPNRKATGIFFRGQNGYLRYAFLHAGRWHVDARTFRSAGRVTGAIAATYSSVNRHSEVFFRGGDGYLHRYYLLPRKGWQYDTKSFRRGGKVAGSISVLYAQQRKHSEVFYRGTDGYLRYFYRHAGRWSLDARTFRRRGHQVSGSIAAVYAKQRRHAEVLYRSKDGHVRYFYLHRGWKLDAKSFRSGGQIHGPIAVAYSPKRRHIEFYYANKNGSRRFFYVQGAWKLHTWPGTKPNATPKNNAKPGTTPFAIKFPVNKVIYTIYQRVPVLKKLLRFKNPKLTVTGGDGKKGTFEKASLTGQVDVLLPKIQKGTSPIVPRIKKITMNVEVSFSGAFEEFELKATSRFGWKRPFGISFLSLDNVGFEVKYNRSDKEFLLAFLGTATVGKQSFPGRMMLQVGSPEKAKDSKPKKSKRRKRRDKRIMDRRRKKGVKRRRKKKKKKKASKLEITDISIQLDDKVKLGDLPILSKIPLIRKLVFRDLKLAMSEISATVTWKGKFTASAAIVYRGDEKMIAMRVKDMRLGGLLPKLPPMLANMTFPELMVVIAAKDFNEKTTDDLPENTATLFEGVVEDDDELPIQSGVNILTLFSPRMFPSKSPFRKALENELGIKESLILGAALGGFQKKPTKMTFFASLPGFKLPSKIIMGGRLRPNPLREVLSLSRTRLFLRVNTATKLLQVGLSGGINLKLPRLAKRGKSDRLKLIGEVYVQVEGQKYGIRVAGRMAGTWNEPFGLGNFALKNPAVVVGYGGGNNVTVGFGGTLRVKFSKYSMPNTRNRWKEYSVDFITSVVIMKPPVINKLGFRLRAGRLSPLMAIEISDRFYRGVLLGPMSQVIVKQLPPKARRLATQLQRKIKKTNIMEVLRIDKLPLPLLELHDTDLYFATPNATIPGRERTMTGMGIGIAGKAQVRFMGKIYKLGALQHYLTVADGYILKAHLEPRKLGTPPFQFNLKAAKVDIKANFSDLPHFKVHGDITDPLGSRGKIKVELSARRAQLLGHIDIKKVLKLYVNARTTGSSLLTATDFKFDAHTKDTLDSFVDKTLIPMFPPHSRNTLRHLAKVARSALPITFKEVRIKGSLKQFVTGTKPVTLSIKHQIHGKTVRPINMSIKPIWSAKGKRDMLMSLFPTHILATRLLNSYMQNSPMGPGTPFQNKLLINVASGKCLVSKGHNKLLQLGTCQDRIASQRWQFNKRNAWQLKSTKGLCADAAGGGIMHSQQKLQLWSCHVGSNQKWKLKDNRIMSMLGIYCWEATGNRVVLAKCDHRSRFQKWRVASRGSGTKAHTVNIGPSTSFKVCLRTKMTGKYVGVSRSGLAVHASADACLAWEKQWIQHKRRDLLRSWRDVSIRSHRGLWSAQANGGLQANRGHLSAWERFRIYKIGAKPGTPIKNGDTVAIYSTTHKRWVKFHKGGVNYVRADSRHPKAWEQFIISFR